ncbi:PsiF family protein [Ramlibacter sp. MMS24-I3-19]|uniref:PsiF family protein n=1 Tax=Ramlibacter sp. MMS24-I3-19 TaxID=3416606 RepID=UPI003CFE6230
MHKSLSLVAAALALSLATAANAKEAPAADAKPSDSRVAQQSRMKTCNADAKAKALKGAERKAFMGECLRKKA